MLMFENKQQNSSGIMHENTQTEDQMLTGCRARTAGTGPQWLSPSRLGLSQTADEL